jgi:CPA2 family monovalent cation:H+ antiporter-2
MTGLLPRTVTLKRVHSIDLILTLTGGLTAALLFGYVTQRLGLSPIVGYLIGGTLIGPNTPGFVADAHLAEQMAEVGVILLMFGVGLQFHIEELLAVRRIAVPGAIAQSAGAAVLGYGIAIAAGWSWQAGIIFGIALSVASTVVLVRVLTDHRDLHTKTGHTAVGWLVVEDLFTVIALVLLPVLLGTSTTSVGVALGITALKVSALVGFTVFAGRRLIPYLLDRVAATRSRELFTLTILVLALGIAVGSASLFGVSMALGAFLAGMVVGQSDYSQRAAADALTMRDAFAVLFFISVGMLLDPAALLESPLVLAATLAVVLVGKPLIAFVIVRVMQYPFRVALSVAVALGQIGEFSFILAALGKQLGVFTAVATNTLVAVSIISIVVNPMLYRSVPAVERWASSWPWLWRLLNGSAGMPSAGGGQRPRSEARYRAVVVGYGPTGRTVARLLKDNGVEPTIVELNMDTVRAIKALGMDAIYGDASHRDTLVAAELSGASVLILTSADIAHTEDVIKTARQQNADLRVLARATHLREREKLRAAGADVVFSGEGEVALAFTESILARLGATAEQIDRERERVRAELFGQSRA